MIVIKDRRRFEEVRKAIISGTCPPSTGQLKKRYHMDYYTARDYLRKLLEEGLLERNETNSHYSLKPELQKRQRKAYNASAYERRVN
jgi:DNA-binding IclR family transcriptional regulator